MGGHLANWDAFCMYRLADAISTNDWSKQDTAITNETWDEPSYFSSKLNLLKSIDFSKVDIITISYGTNDFTGGNSVYSETNPYGLYTYAGALMHSIEVISEAYPNIEIVLCTPIYRVWREDGNILDDSDTYEIEGRKLTDYVQMTKDIAEKYNLVCIDNYYGNGINRDSIDVCFSASDGVHPNKVGRQMIAEHMAKELYEAFGK